MPREDQVFTVQHKKKDGSVLSARVSVRPEGTYEIDLRKWKKGRPTLKRRGERAGTTNCAEARELAVDMLAGLGAGNSGATDHSIAGPITQLKSYIQRKLDSHQMSRETAEHSYTKVERVWQHFADDKGYLRWDQVRRMDMDGLYTYLETHEFTSNNRTYKLKTNSVRGHVNTFKGFLRWLVDNEIVESSPAHRHGTMPELDKSFTRDWLEPAEIGHLLQVVFAGRADYRHNACTEWPEILATEAYTGARSGEVLGLAFSEYHPAGGVHGAGTIVIKDNAWRTLKNSESEREVSLWPAHGAILREYVARKKPPTGGLLFPSRDGGMWGDLRYAMTRDLAAAGIEKNITPHSMRHSYVSARARMYKLAVVQGVIAPVPVHIEDIKIEIGHGLGETTEAVYLHASKHPVEGVVELNYADFLKGLGSRRSAGKRASASAARTKRKR